MIKSPNHINGGVYTVNGNINSFDKIKTDWVNTKSDEVSNIDFKPNNKNKCCLSFCCCYSQNDSMQISNEERFGLLGSSKNIVKVDLRETERHMSMDHVNESIPDLSATASDGISEHETGRISHIDRELPPIPKIIHMEPNNTNFKDSNVEPEIISMSESENYNELKPLDDIDNDQQNSQSGNQSTISRERFNTPSPSLSKLENFQRSNNENRTCCCGSHQDILSSDDLSSNDYDPTYAAIKRKKPSCPMCGVPSVYTPANSNRNSNLSLQFNSCLTSPIRNPGIKPSICDSLCNSTYASIAKFPKLIPENKFNNDKDNSGSSTIKRQRSISQGDIMRTNGLKSRELQQGDINMKDCVINYKNKDLMKNHRIFNNPGLATISLWSLMASNRNSPYSMFPLIPERTYGQSVVDLIEKLRESERHNIAMKHSAFALNDMSRSYTPPNLFKKSGSMNSRGRIWTPPSCQMVHGNEHIKSGLCSPLKIFDRNSTSYDFNFPDINYFGSHRKGNPSFQPKLTPPLSPMDCLSSEKDDNYEIPKFGMPEKDQKPTSNSEIILQSATNDNRNKIIQAATSVYEDLDCESVIAADREIEVINEEINFYINKSDDYDYLLNTDQFKMNGEMELIGYSDIDSILLDETVMSRTRPISIHLYGDDSLTYDKSIKYRLDKCEILGFSSVQMSPLMEQSIENSSSKTTLSSLSFHHFNRLISSEDSCAKSPPSAELSPSLDNLEITTETGAFIYSDIMWSKLNSAFDDYDTFE